MKRLSITALAVAAVGVAAPIAAQAASEIYAPGPDELVYQNMLTVQAFNGDTIGRLLDANAIDRTTPGWLAWAVRKDTCAADDTKNVVGDTATDVFVPGPGELKSFDAGVFSAVIDISNVEAGRYCFIFNPTDRPGERATQWFYIVDEYAKVSGRIIFDPVSGTRPDGPFLPMPGNSPTHTFDGLVGKAGPIGILGSIEINYRELPETCVLTPTNLTLDNDAPGINFSGGPMLRAVIPFTSSCGNGTFFAVDKTINLYTPSIGPRGGIVMRVGGTAPVTKYHIDNTLGVGGGASWVTLERGEANVGNRLQSN